MLLKADRRYRYGKQVSKWVEQEEDLPLATHDTYDTSIVVRQDRHGRLAIFKWGPCTPLQRYRLEVLMGCEVVPKL